MHQIRLKDKLFANLIFKCHFLNAMSHRLISATLQRISELGELSFEVTVG